MPRVAGLGHLGIFVRDIERMTAFYRDFLGMQVTKQDPAGRMIFLSSDPESVDHEIALMSGRAEDDGPPLIQQISLRVPSLNDLRTFHRNLTEQGYRIDQVVTISAIGCYRSRRARTEVFLTVAVGMIGIPIDIDWPDVNIMADIDAIWQRGMRWEKADAAAIAVRRARTSS
jgi:catechol 2,3-dioxygenase-like lactoylglutathione lyase family enzyme